MAETLTVTGSNNTTVPVTFDSTSNFVLAQQIAAQINAAIAAGNAVIAVDNQAPPTVPAGPIGVLFQYHHGPVVLPPGYTVDIVKTIGPAVLFGNGAAGEAILSDTTANLTFVADSGSGSVVAGGGTSRIQVSGSGDWSLNSGNGNDVIFAVGSGNNTIQAGGGQNAIGLGAGNDVVVSAGRDFIQGTTGAETIDASTAKSDFVQGINSNLLFLGGHGGATIFGGTGSDTYLGSTGTVTGAQYIVGGTGGNNHLSAGDGHATLIGNGQFNRLDANGPSNQVLIAGTGYDTLSAVFSTGNDSLRAGPGSDTLLGGIGNETFVAGTGNATISAGPSTNVYEFIKGQAGGSDLVQGVFDPSNIKISLQNYGNDAVDNALASQTPTPGGLTITLSDGTTITFQNVTAINRSNFI